MITKTGISGCFIKIFMPCRMWLHDHGSRINVSNQQNLNYTSNKSSQSCNQICICASRQKLKWPTIQFLVAQYLSHLMKQKVPIFVCKKYFLAIYFMILLICLNTQINCKYLYICIFMYTFTEHLWLFPNISLLG